MPRRTQVRALEHAATQLGGVPALAKRLGILRASLEGWIGGQGEVPAHTFLDVVDILLDHNGRPRD